MDWKKDATGGMWTSVLILLGKKQDGTKIIGSYNIHVTRRPIYCDRGDWLIFMDGKNDIDFADGFPRYFIGSEDEVKDQMKRWLNRRKCYQDYLRALATD